MKFNINKLSRHFDEISSIITSGRELTEFDHETIELHLAELHQFINACVDSAKEIEDTLAWHRVHRS